MKSTRSSLLTVTGIAGILLLSACGGQSSPTADASSTSASASASSPASDSSEETEVSTPTTRVALSYDGGIMIVDGRTMEMVDTVEKDGFLRLSQAGDNRHLAVANGNSYSLLDMGHWGQAHGDHSHYYSAKPTLSDWSWDSEETSHVISDNGKTAFFSDGSGSFEVVDPLTLTGDDKKTAAKDSIETKTVTLPEPHHGFAIPLPDDQYMVAVGNEDQRTGAAIVDENGKTVTKNNQCPGVHGEAIVANNTFTVGCEDGVLIYKNGELERPEQFSLVNTETDSIQKVQLPEGVSYTFRSIARGPEGEALLLTTDGKLRAYDEETGEELASVDLMNSWTESEVWQEPRPAIWVQDDTAYVTDPATKKLHAVSLANIANGSMEDFAQLELPETPNEINGVSARDGVAPEAEGDEHDH
ncbi:hypothetical protein ACIP5Z_05670 [Rothia terrae]|uniref:hypothetical protein n=1 Tax=Rothia terrae TaxID=396015 RepID=UPI003824409B